MNITYKFDLLKVFVIILSVITLSLLLSMMYKFFNNPIKKLNISQHNLDKILELEKFLVENNAPESFRGHLKKNPEKVKIFNQFEDLYNIIDRLSVIDEQSEWYLKDYKNFDDKKNHICLYQFLFLEKNKLNSLIKLDSFKIINTLSSNLSGKDDKPYDKVIYTIFRNNILLFLNKFHFLVNAIEKSSKTEQEKNKYFKKISNANIEEIINIFDVFKDTDENIFNSDDQNSKKDLQSKTENLLGILDGIKIKPMEYESCSVQQKENKI